MVLSNYSTQPTDHSESFKGGSDAHIRTLKVYRLFPSREFHQISLFSLGWPVAVFFCFVDGETESYGPLTPWIHIPKAIILDLPDHAYVRLHSFCQLWLKMYSTG